MRLRYLPILLLELLAAPAYAGETITYSYDTLGRLIAAGHAGSVNNAVGEAFSYDPAGNRNVATVTGAASNSPPKLVVVVPLNGFTVIPIQNSGF